MFRQKIDQEATAQGARLPHCLCCKDSVRSTKQPVPLHADKTQYIDLLWALVVVNVWPLY